MKIRYYVKKLNDDGGLIHPEDEDFTGRKYWEKPSNLFDFEGYDTEGEAEAAIYIFFCDKEKLSYIDIQLVILKVYEEDEV